MKTWFTVRNTLIVSTLSGVILLAILSVVAWTGFTSQIDRLRLEHTVSQPARAAMADTRFNVVQVQQFLTDVSATADPGGYEEARRAYDEAQKDLDTIARLQPDLVSQVEQIRAKLKTFNETGMAMADAYVRRGREAGNAAMKRPGDGFDARAEELTTALTQLETTLQDRVAASAGENEGRISDDRRNTAILGVFVALLSVISGFTLYRFLLRLLGGEPAHAVGVAQRIATGDFSSEIVTRPGDATSLMVSLGNMQKSLLERITADRQIAAENLRVRSALDNVSTGVMIADSERNIIYCNKEVRTVLKAAEADIRQSVPGFSADNLIGRNIDLFHRNPSHQAGLLATLSGTHTAELRLGARHLRVIANPVLMTDGTRVGSVAEWRDRTVEVNVQSEIAAMVDAASQGDFSQRLNLDGKEGFFREVAAGLNRLADTTSAGLAEVAAVMQQLAEGDLTSSIDANYGGVFGRLMGDTNRTVERLRAVVSRIKEATEAINTASQEIAAGNADLSRRTESQASSLEETSSSMMDLQATVKRTADNSQQASTLSRSSNETAVKGGEIVGQMVTTMSGIQEGSKRIADIVGLIDSIAFQTNILALNAAVEAARAGEQGRGFAVVASEVRSLAQRSATAAKEIKNLIDESVHQVNNGNALATKAGTTMDEIVLSFRKVADLVAEISSAGREQAAGIDQVTQAVGQMDEVTQQNAALVEQAAAAAESLEEQTRGLVAAVGMFRLPEADGAPFHSVRALPGPA